MSPLKENKYLIYDEQDIASLQYVQNIQLLYLCMTCNE